MATRNPLSRNPHCAADTGCRSYDHTCPDEVAEHEDAVYDGEPCQTCGLWPLAVPQAASFLRKVAR